MDEDFILKRKREREWSSRIAAMVYYIVTCQVHPVKCTVRFLDPVSCRCPEPRVGLLETPPRWHATILVYKKLIYHTVNTLG